MRIRYAAVLLGSLCLAVASAPAMAIDHEVTISGLNFSPDTLVVAPGDTITWSNPNAFTHTVTSGSGCSGDGTFNSTLRGGASFSWTVPAGSGGLTYDYYCIPHCGAGMTGTITVADHVVDVNGLSFDPAVIQVGEGDVVLWVHQKGGFHTITEEDPDSKCTTAAKPLFAVPIDEGELFHFQIPKGQTESIYYYCIPHCFLDMRGILEIEPDCPESADFNKDGSVDGEDLGALLGSWNTSNPVTDINCDGIVDGVDLGALLGQWSI